MNVCITMLSTCIIDPKLMSIYHVLHLLRLWEWERKFYSEIDPYLTKKKLAGQFIWIYIQLLGWNNRHSLTDQELLLKLPSRPIQVCIHSLHHPDFQAWTICSSMDIGQCSKWKRIWLDSPRKLLIGHVNNVPTMQLNNAVKILYAIIAIFFSIYSGLGVGVYGLGCWIGFYGWGFQLMGFWDIGTKRQWRNANTQDLNTKMLPQPKTQNT